MLKVMMKSQRKTDGKEFLKNNLERQGRMKKKIISMLSIVSMILCSCINVYAAPSDDTCDVYLDIWMDDDMTIQPGDIFEVSYHLQDGDDIQTFSVDLNNISETLSFDAGTYIVTDVTYIGDNSLFDTSGYAVFSEFIVDSDDAAYNEFILAIGPTEGNKLNRLYSDVLLKENGAFVKELGMSDIPTPSKTEVSSTYQEPDKSEETAKETYVINLEPNIVAEESSDDATDDANFLQKYIPNLFMKAIPLIALGICMFAFLYVSFIKKNR